MAKRTSKAKVLSSKEVYHGPIFRITSDQVVEPGGDRAYRRDIVRHPGSVVIMAVDESGRQPRVLLARQYRHAVKDYLWELPAGRVDDGENELSAAKRELLEETGYSAGSWKRILKFYASPGYIDETMAVYLARNLRPGTAQPEDDEVIDLRFFELPTAVEQVMNSRMRDGKTIAAVLWLKESQSTSKARK